MRDRKKNTHTFCFVTNFDLNSAETTIENDEHNHLYKILKLTPNTKIELTNCNGLFADALILDVTKSVSTVKIIQVYDKSKQSLYTHELVLSAPKPKIIDELLPALTELGIAKITIVLDKKSPKHLISSTNLDRWKRICVQALKQCKASSLPALQTYKSFQDYIDSNKTNSTKDDGRFILHPESESTLISHLLNGDLNQNCIYVIGNETGLDDEAISLLLNNKFTTIKISPNTLRAKTAIMAIASLISFI